MDPRTRWLSWIELDRDALAHNLATFRALLHPSTKLLQVVKANAYGHGLALVVQAASSSVDAFGVHTLEEAQAVREAGWTGLLLLMGPFSREATPVIADLDLEVTVFEPTAVQSLDELGRSRGKRIPCHLKVETGTHRQGADLEEIPALLDLFRASPGVRLAGLSTHYANIEDTTDHSFALDQLTRFRSIAELVRSRGFEPLTRHTACTAAALTLPDTLFDLLRLGIGAYGLWPSRETLASTRARSALELKPVLGWKTRVTQLKWVEAGEYVGYGLAHRCGHRTRLGVLPIGYADGYQRIRTNRVGALVRGERVPLVGTIAMDAVMADVTDVAGPPVTIDDEFVLLGRQGDRTLTAAELAHEGTTISWEVLAGMARRLPRVYYAAARVVGMRTLADERGCCQSDSSTTPGEGSRPSGS